MRLTSPPSLRLERTRLLADLVDRVARTRPELVGALGDPADPTWILIEQAAWMVERLSEQLDQLPQATLQRLGSWLGAQLRPAQPSIGVVTARPRASGTLGWGLDRPAPWRLFTGQTETRGLIEFAFFERGAPLRPAGVLSWTEVADGALVSRSSAETPHRRGPAAPVKALAGARVRYRIATPTPDELAQRLEAAASALRQRRIGWLCLEVRAAPPSEVILEAWVDLAGVFKRSAPDGRTPGGDLEGDLGSLDAAPWTPSVRLGAEAGLPRSRVGELPLPGRADGVILVPDLPPDLPVAGLLEGRAWPLPPGVVDAIWSSLVHHDTSLAGLRPTVDHRLPADLPAGEPAWLASALNARLFSRIASGEGRQILHVRLEDRGGVPLRLALIHPRGLSPQPPEVFGLSRGQLQSESSLGREAWTLALPAADQPGMVSVTAFDLSVSPEADALIVAFDAGPTEVALNATLVINAPPVLDGRELTLRRAVPEAVTLLQEDVVDRGVMDGLLEHPLPAPVRQHLRRLPLASFSVSSGPPIRDLEGLSVDAPSGELSFGAPDGAGRVRELPVGASVSLDWYRCTDGERGDVEPGAIRYVEMPPGAAPAIDEVHNPLGTYYGLAREPEEACRARLFGPADPSPVLPGDWERAIHAELGARGQGWAVRCWSHAEFGLLSYALWPPDPDDSAATALRSELEVAGPDVLLVALGPLDHALNEADLAWAGDVVADLVRRTWARRPLVREAVVTRLWPLTLRGAAPSGVVFPNHHPGELGGAPLVDGAGRRFAAPRERLLLNGVVLAAVAEEAP